MKTKRSAPHTHPAAIAAESDLVKLTREFEALRNALRDLGEHTTSSNDKVAASRNAHDDLVNREQAFREGLARERKVLVAKIENVRELLTKQGLPEPKPTTADVFS